MPLFTVNSDKDGRESSSPELVPSQQSSCSVSMRHFLSVATDGSDTEATSKKSVFAGVWIVISLLSFTSFELWQYNPRIAYENGLLEIAQDLLLLIAFVAALLRYWSIRASETFDSHIFLALTLFSLAFFLREVDIDKIGNSPLWPIAEKTLRAIAAVSLLGFTFSVLRRVKFFWRNLASILAAPVVMLTIMAGLLYICSWPFDKKIFFIDRGFSQMCEETIELNACLLFVFAAFARGVRHDQKLL